ncbi:hypothetical protein DPMN_170490 [Dreissena polymorpha]|uniref:Uncharacterized protein n=1 Tax=Dreissena polymorpha TaxID=45954 RepID=A0A9D4DYI0_DREPO|nr:hypothetical protein DPMN_170490 [Dreissena polymorpha]
MPQRMPVRRTRKITFTTYKETIIQDRPKKSIIILMGNFDALIGIDNQGYDEIMEKQGLSEMCDNGEWFTNLLATRDL